MIHYTVKYTEKKRDKVARRPKQKCNQVYGGRDNLKTTCKSTL